MAFELIKVSELPELTTPSDPNVIPIQDGDYLKRISFENLKEAVTDDVADDLAAEVTAREGAVSGEATARGNADTAILADLASPYSASSTYAVGDYCTKDGQLYRCTTAISTAEAWTAAHWSAVALGDDTRDLRSALSYIEPIVAPVETSIVLANGTIQNPNNANAVRTSSAIPCKVGDTITVYPARQNTSGYYYAYGYRIYDSDGTTIKNEGDASNSFNPIRIADSSAASIDIFWVETDGANYIPLRANTYGIVPCVIVRDGSSLTEKFDDLTALTHNLPPQYIADVTRTGWNYLTDALANESGKYWNGATIGQPISLANNATYTAVMIAADASVYDFTAARYVHALDANQKLLQVVTTSGTTSFDNTLLGAAYLCFTFYTSGMSTTYICKHGTPSYAQYTVADEWIFENIKIGAALHIFLPSKIYCAVGRTIELYNEQVLLEWEKYHLQWYCTKGVAYKRKFSITGEQADIGSYTLTLNVYDDLYNIVATKTATLIICDDDLASSFKILPIGDSLTNGKAWLSEVPTLSNSKISYIGTRQTSSRNSEGRSGVGTGWYVANSSYTYADGSTYIGNTEVIGTSNPFWDGSKFSLNHYMTKQASFVGTPDAVQFFLGTNDLLTPDTVVANLKTMVDTIHTEYPTMPVFICETIFHSNQNGYYESGGEGYVGVMSNWQYKLDIATITLMEKIAEAFDTAAYSGFVTIVPLASCMDREYDFGRVEVNVNPRSTVKEYIPNQYTHPQDVGYLQIADTLFSAYCHALAQ